MKLVTNKSKNLLYRIVDGGNVIVQFTTSYAVATQRTSDSATAIRFKIVAYKGTDYYSLTDMLPVSSVGKFTKTFTTSSTTGYDRVTFGLNGSKVDTMCNCAMDLKPSTTYTFTCNFTNITQGSISWKDMMLVEGSTVGEYEPYSYNLLDKWQFESTHTSNGVNWTNNGDGSIIANGYCTGFTAQNILANTPVNYTHKYLFNPNYASDSTNTAYELVFINDNTTIYTPEGRMNPIIVDISNYENILSCRINLKRLYDSTSGVYTYGYAEPVLYDLTLMYGTGNEPTTVEQFYTDYPELKVSPLGFIGLKNLEISNKNIKRLKYKTSSGNVDLGIIPSNSGYILDKYNNLSEELLEENIEKDNINYHIPDKTNILLNKVEGKTNKIVQEIDVTRTSATTTKNGVTCTNNRDGSWTVNGTSTATETTYFRINNENTLPAINGHTYCTLGCPSGGGNKTYFIESTFGYDFGNGVIYKLNRDIGYGNYYIGIAAGYTASNLIFRPQVFDLTAMYGFGNEPTTVEQFKKDYPQFFDSKLDGIWNVRTSGISTTGKNLFDFSKYYQNTYSNVSNGTLVEKLSNGVIAQGNNGTGNGDNSYSNGWFVPTNYPISLWTHLKAGTYTVSADYTMIENSIVSTAWVGCYLYGDHQYTSSPISVTAGNTVRVKNTYTVVEGNYYPIFTLNSGKVKIENIQIELNSTVTAYEPYQENKIDLLSTQTLNGINGVNDYIEVIDKGNGLYDLKKTQNIASVDLGTLDWLKTTVFYIPDASYINPNSYGLCKEFQCVPSTISMPGEDHFETRTDNYLYFWYTSDSTYKDMTTAQFKAVMSGKILYYQLKTPVTTTIATNLTYNQVSAIRTNGGLLLVNYNNNQKYAQPNVTIKENYQYKN